MKTRTLKQLYTLLLKRIKKESKGKGFIFICNQIGFLNSDDETITEKEHKKLLNNFHKNKPSSTKHVKFYKHKSYIDSPIAWWDSYEVKQRILFIEHLISKLK